MFFLVFGRCRRVEARFGPVWSEFWASASVTRGKVGLCETVARRAKRAGTRSGRDPRAALASLGGGSTAKNSSPLHSLPTPWNAPRAGGWDPTLSRNQMSACTTNVWADTLPPRQLAAISTAVSDPCGDLPPRRRVGGLCGFLSAAEAARGQANRAFGRSLSRRLGWASPRVAPQRGSEPRPTSVPVLPPVKRWDLALPLWFPINHNSRPTLPPRSSPLLKPQLPSSSFSPSLRPSSPLHPYPSPISTTMAGGAAPMPQGSLKGIFKQKLMEKNYSASPSLDACMSRIGRGGLIVASPSSPPSSPPLLPRHLPLLCLGFRLRSP